MQYDKKVNKSKFKVGNKVLLCDEIMRRDRLKKLDVLWIGSYVVLEKINDVNYDKSRSESHVSTRKPIEAFCGELKAERNKQVKQGANKYKRKNNQ